jgi:hypothetical protein
VEAAAAEEMAVEMMTRATMTMTTRSHFTPATLDLLAGLHAMLA